jgi:hypothetical protein
MTEVKRWTVEFQNGHWAPVVAVNPWLPTTKNYFAADAVAKQANHLKLKWTEWTRVFDMLSEMDARLSEAADEEESRAEAATTEPSDTITYRLAVWDDEQDIFALFKQVAPDIPISLNETTEDGMVTEIVQCRGGSWVAVDAAGKIAGLALARRDLKAKDRATAIKYVGADGNSRGRRICSNLINKLKAKGISLTASVSGNRSSMADRLVKYGFKKVESDDNETKFRWDSPDAA